MSVDFEGIGSLDPFDEAEADFGDSTKSSNYIHIRIQQRNGRKSLTTIQGLDPKLDFKRLVKAFKRAFCCNGTIVNDDALGTVIQLSGDQRRNIADFLVSERIAKKGAVKIHGF